MKSDQSMIQPILFSEEDLTTEERVFQNRPDSLVPSCLSMKSDQSMIQPILLSEGDFTVDQRLDHGGEFLVKSGLKKCRTRLKVQQEIKIRLKQKYQILCEGTGPHGNQTLLKDIYTELYITEGGSGGVNNEHEVRQIEMASKRQTRHDTPIKCRDIFKPIKHLKWDLNHLPEQDNYMKKKGLRNLTKGIAGIGKTVSVQKVILDWAEGTANQDIHFIFPLPFRDLNLKKDQYSLMTLLSHYFPETEEIDRMEDGGTKMVFIFDGLDECRLPLDFKNNKKIFDATEPTSVDVLLTNLIEGNLLPSALLWITTRPAAANQIPPEYVDQFTEIRGFSEPQKEEYFRKKITDQNLATEIIKHIKTSRSLHIMCHIPVFCWISATVLEIMLKEAEKDAIPKTLTQMNVHFLLMQVSVKNMKYNKSTETNPKELSQSDKDMILKLSKLAFQQLQKGNLIFYEEDLRECGIDVLEASEYSALCTEIFKEESGLNQEKVFSFVHLTIQEFLAAVHSLESCLGKNKDVFSPSSDYNKVGKSELSELHRTAVNHALESENGHLDLFLRFLLGLSLESNQNLLQGILTQTGSTTQSNEETVKRTVEYLSGMIKKESSPERIINLFHCLNELGANSLVEERQISLQSETLYGTKLEPHQCSAITYLLLMSEEVLGEFNLKRYNTTEAGYQRLLPVVKTCKRALLDDCGLTHKSCETLASALQTPDSPLTELDLSYNHVEDRGVELLCPALTSPFCNIQTLILDGCGLTYKSCETLASALQTQKCPLRGLDLSYNHLKDRGVELLCAEPTSPLFSIQTLVLGYCGLTEVCCSDLASILRSPNSQLKQLELKDNDLKDSGVKLLSAGLEDPSCKLQTLGLSGCLVTEEGCAALASALRSNPSHLRKLDLSYNHPGDSGVRLLSAGLEDPHRIMEKLDLDHGGEFRMKSGPRKYACEVILDPNTAARTLSLSDQNKTVTSGEKQPFPDHPERFQCWEQVLCKEGLSGRHYWELEWSEGGAGIAVTYEAINRKGWGCDSWLGSNDKSWSLICSGNSYTAWYNNKRTTIPELPSSSWSNRVGVYLDWPAGTLSFYRVSSDTLIHLHTFHSTFIEPLYPGFFVGPGSSVSLCQVV
ncbi:NACHT, LRR and PYD domains-containing protein 12-like isoform X2 [Esox lucius]|nr:NACHT, LRR and PYD domains-containing protein 12-like isoform X2 [Esox lucius]